MNNEFRIVWFRKKHENGIHLSSSNKQSLPQKRASWQKIIWDGRRLREIKDEEKVNTHKMLWVFRKPHEIQKNGGLASHWTTATQAQKNSYEHEEEEYSNDVGYAANAAEDASAAHRKSRGKKGWYAPADFRKNRVHIGHLRASCIPPSFRFLEIGK